MARGHRSRRQTRKPPLDPTLTASYELSLDNTPYSPKKFSADAISADRRRLYRDPVPLPTCDAPSAIPALNEDATLDWLGHSDGVFEPPQIGASAPDPFFLESDPEAGEGDGVLPLEEGATRYMTSDEPMKLWISRRDVYLGELLRHDGRGCYGRNRCESCPDGVDGGSANIRCLDCLSDAHVCSTCAVQRHVHNPWHRVQRWEGRAYEATTLRALGMVVRLGHGSDRSQCSNPILRPSFTVVDLNGRHVISVQFCGCDKAGNAGDHVQQLLRRRLYPATDVEPNTAFTFSLLAHYHIQSLQGKISMYDYYTSVERLTDNTGTQRVSDRYRAFMRVVAQWRHLKRLKRSGRGHDPAGVEGTQAGELAVRCPACPQPNINLPSNWATVSDDLQYLYMLTVAVDACFRLKRRMVSNETKDPSFGSGWGYFVEDSCYKEVLAEYKDQEEISTCTGLSAIDHANTKYSKGYAATGIGAVVCARHEFWLPNGAGDLQKGEKYINMDYVFVSSMRDWLVVKKLVSYDIACQWSKNIVERISKLPSHLQIPVPEGSISYPRDPRHSQYSLNYRLGCARTDGEGIERRWWWIQPIANSTKVMGPGMRQGMLEDQWGYSNWRKTVDLGSLDALLRLKEAEREYQEHKSLFDALTATLDPDRCREWEGEVEAWEANPAGHDDPYVVVSQGLTESETARELSKEEQAASALPGFVAVHSVSMLGFVTLGLEIEAQQRHLSDDAKAAIPSRLSELYERRTSLRRKVQRFRDLQGVYMPAASLILSEDPACRTDVQEVERIRLGLPSEISASRRSAICSPRLLEIEARLREGQCRSALQDLRGKLHTIHQLYSYKRLNVRNQGPNTRARAGIAHQECGKDLAVRRYRCARRAKLALSGPGDWEKELQVLEDGDIRGLEEDDPLSVKSKRKRRRGDVQDPAEGRRRMSWIWHSADKDGASDMIDSLRVEWLKVRARQMRWAEEVKLLPEEMRRVLATYRYEHQVWMSRSAAPPSTDPALKEGMVSYAVRQARIRSAMAQVFRRICLPVAESSSPSAVQDWDCEGWCVGSEGQEIAAEQEGLELMDYLMISQLDGEDLGT
ncbi:hypothetical protein C8Q70DRAFT_1048186 [Cubamyces menziesii]|nr:hypothetical protein C8Q70DRAFT_1048186 [Cubamyces menziesii]